MKTAFVNFSLLSLMFLCLFASTEAQVKRTTQKTIEPTAKEAIKQIFLNGDVLLSAGKNCASVGTSQNDKTILDFLSGVLSFQAEPDTRNAVEFSFKQERGKRNEILWVCDVIFRGGDAESPSSNGIRFKMLNSDRRLMRESLMCIGTG
jgi:hypothetical protein